MLEDDKAMYDEGDYDDDDNMLEANVIAWVNRCVVNTLLLHANVRQLRHGSSHSHGHKHGRSQDGDDSDDASKLPSTQDKIRDSFKASRRERARKQKLKHANKASHGQSRGVSAMGPTPASQATPPPKEVRSAQSHPARTTNSSYHLHH